MPVGYSIPLTDCYIQTKRQPSSNGATPPNCPTPDHHFDAVLTDPPYYDSVSYSDLADMQYVWLHRALG